MTAPHSHPLPARPERALIPILLAVFLATTAQTFPEKIPPVAFEWACDGHSMAIAPSGQLLVGANQGVLLYEPNGTLRGLPPLLSDPFSGSTQGATAIAIDPSGNCVVGTNSCVQQFRPAGSLVWIRSLGARGLAIDPAGRTYVLHPGDDVIYRYSRDGLLDKVWSTADLGAGRFSGGAGIAIDPRGFVYLADSGNGRVQKYGLDMNWVDSWEVADGSIRLGHPSAVAVDASGDVFVTTQNPAGIVKFSSDGRLLTHWGSIGSAPGQISRPTHIAVARNGNLYVFDSGSKVVVYGDRLAGAPPTPPPPPPPPPPPIPPPPPAPKIQEWIDRASNGHTITVPPGTYRENLDFKGKTLTLVSDGGAGVTVIDGSAHPTDPTVTIGEGTKGAVLRGFTITGSQGESAVRFGGVDVLIEGNIIRDNTAVGILVRSGTATIRGNTFQNNRTDDWGAAILVYTVYGNPVSTVLLAENNTFLNNYARLGSVLTVDNADVTFRGNRVDGNSSRYDGGAIFTYSNDGNVLIEHNEFLNSTCGDHGGAIAAWDVYGGHVDVRFNLFAHNRASGTGPKRSPGSGGAIHMASRTGTFVNNTVVFNSADEDCGGGGVALDGEAGANWTIERNIIAWNGHHGLICAGNSTPSVFRDNIIFDGTTSDINCQNVSSRTLATFENVVARDPMFCDPGGGDFHLASGSPALQDGEAWGAYPDESCAEVPIVPSTWSALKARTYH